jgi:hypothetical protein
VKYVKLGLCLVGLCLEICLLSSCTPRQTQETQTSQNLIGKLPFQFQPNQVEELFLSKADPAKEDYWNTTLRKTDKQWEISFTPSQKAVLDRLVDETFINHLIDLFQNIRITAPAPRGPLDSYGLNPPKFAIRWKTHDQTFEFLMGQPAPHDLGTYFSVDGETVYIAKGPAFRMLNMITSFEFLRHRPWTTLSADDIDEIQILKNGKTDWYAQREGDLWTNAAHKKTGRNISKILNSITQTRPLQMVDDKQQAHFIHKEIQKHSSYQAKLSDRLGNVSSLHLYLKKGTLYGTNSTRPNSVFILDQKFFKEL